MRMLSATIEGRDGRHIVLERNAREANTVIWTDRATGKSGTINVDRLSDQKQQATFDLIANSIFGPHGWTNSDAYDVQQLLERLA